MQMVDSRAHTGIPHFGAQLQSGPAHSPVEPVNDELALLIHEEESADHFAPSAAHSTRPVATGPHGKADAGGVGLEAQQRRRYLMRAAVTLHACTRKSTAAAFKTIHYWRRFVRSSESSDDRCVLLPSAHR
jgi:hypothetical protein